MREAFLTGSRVYGKPGRKADIDLVVYLRAEEIDQLRELAEEEDPLDEYYRADGKTVSLRFGRLNLLCCTDPVAVAVWHEGTRTLSMSDDKPFHRNFVIAFFDALRTARGLANGTTAGRVLESCLTEDETDAEGSWEVGDRCEFDLDELNVLGVIESVDGKKGEAVVRATIGRRPLKVRVPLDSLRKTKAKK